MAGNYIVRNTDYARYYLFSWADLENTLPRRYHANHDNGVLHLHILKYLKSNQSIEYNVCLKEALLCRNSMASYYRFVGCVKCVLGGKRIFPEQKLQIVRRGHAYVRDFFVSASVPGKNTGMVSPNDIFFHGWKDRIEGVWWEQNPNVETCLHEMEWAPKIINSVIGDVAMVASEIQKRERVEMNVDMRRTTVFPILEVGNCWPNCPAELTELQESEIRLAICPERLKCFYDLNPCVDKSRLEHSHLHNEPVAGPEKAKCDEVKDKYQVSPAMSWGKITKEAKQIWIQINCDRFY